MLLLNVREVLKGITAEPHSSVTSLTCGQLVLSVVDRSVVIGDRRPNLNETQFQMVWRLAEQPASILTPRELLGEGCALKDDAVAQLAYRKVWRLRQALAQDRAIIECVRGVGYRLNLRYLGAI